MRPPDGDPILDDFALIAIPLVDELPTIVGVIRTIHIIPWFCAIAAQRDDRKSGTDMNLNDRLIGLRRKRGLSQEQLGYELGISRQTVSKWELAHSYPDLQRLVLLPDYYEISLDELV